MYLCVLTSSAHFMCCHMTPLFSEENIHFTDHCIGWFRNMPNLLQWLHFIVKTLKYGRSHSVLTFDQSWHRCDVTSTCQAVYECLMLCVSRCSWYDRYSRVSRAARRTVGHTGITWVGSKPYCCWFSEKLHTGMSQCQRIRPDYLRTCAIALSRERDL